jgi:hypothetical protein
MKHTIIIEADGTIKGLGNPLGLPGKTTKKRFSEILPTNPALRAAFRTLRKVFGEDGKVAEFTRRWPCQWRATVLETGESMVSNDREFLLSWERERWHEPLIEL